MKQIIGLALLLSLAACSKNSPPSNETPKSDNEIVTILDAKDMTISGNLVVGEFLSTDSSKLVTYKITNSGTEALTGPVVSSDAINFPIAYQNCNSLPVKSSCSVKISFDPKNKSGNYASTLTFDTVTAQLTASVTAPTPPATSVQFLASAVDISVSGLNFGTLTDKQSVLKTITIKNTGTASIVAPTVTLTTGDSSNAYSLTYDACSGKDLAKGASCTVKVTLTGAGNVGLKQSNLNFAGKSTNFVGQVDSSVISSGSGSSGAGSVSLVYMNGSTILSGSPQAYSFGTLSGTSSAQLILNIKNNGTAAFAGGVVTISSTDFSIVYNACDNKQIAAGASCQLRVAFGASGKANNTYTGTLSLGGVSLQLSAIVNTVAAVITYEPQYSQYGSCKVGSVAIAACDGSGEQLRSIQSCRKLSDGVDVGAATLSNCNAFQNDSYLKMPCLSPAGDKTISIANGSRVVNCAAGSSVPNFVSISCDNSSSPSGFHNEDNNSCIANTRTCSPMPDNASIATQVYNNASSSWGSCTITACASSYTLTNNTCAPEQVDVTLNPNAKIRPYNLTIPKGFNPVEFFVSGFTQDTLTVSFPGLPASLVSIQGQWDLGSYMYHVVANIDTNQVPSNGVSGKIRIGNATQGYAETNVTIQGSGIFGVGEMATSQSFLGQPALNFGLYPALAISGSGATKRYSTQIYKTDIYGAGQTQTMGLFGWDQLGAVVQNNVDRISGEVGFGVVRADSQGRTYSFGIRSVGGDDFDIVIKRYLLSGAIDTTFGTNGMKTIKTPDEIAGTVAYNTNLGYAEIIDNKIYISSWSVVANTSSQIRTDLFVLDMDGNPDTSFNGNGYRLIDLRTSEFNQYDSALTTYQSNNVFGHALAIKKESNGSILVAFSVQNKKVSGEMKSSLVIQKFTSSGALDTSFGNGGQVNNFLSSGTDLTAYGESLLGNNLFLFGQNGYYNGADYYKLIKVNMQTGQTDPSFGEVSIRTLAQGLGYPPSEFYFFGAMAAQADGGVVFSANKITTLHGFNGSTSATETPVLMKLDASGNIAFLGSVPALELVNYQGNRIFSIQMDGNELVALAFGNVRGYSWFMDWAHYSLPNPASRFGIFKIDLSSSPSSSPVMDPASGTKLFNVSLMCGPYGDYDAVNSTCVCDSGYDVIDFNDQFEQGLGFFCIKRAPELCSYPNSSNGNQVMWDGAKCSPANSCNNNFMCDMGEDSMNCPMDCGGGGGGSFCGNGMCEMGEDSFNCSMDCGMNCGMFSDQNSCQSNGGCFWQANQNDCSMLGDQNSCQMYGCSWMPMMNDCSMISDENYCNSNMGCSWNYFDMMDPMMGGSCSGQYQDPFNGSCGGGTYMDPYSGYCHN